MSVDLNRRDVLKAGGLIVLDGAVGAYRLPRTSGAKQ
jgi:hypothetical protein